MTGRMHSDSWYRVAELRPQISREVGIHRHYYRGEPWYVLESPADRRVHRFTPETYVVLNMMDGTRTVDELWQQAGESLGSKSPTQDELIQLLGQLHQADVLVLDRAPDIRQVQRARATRDQRKVRQNLLSPLMWRIPLCDPAPLLRRLQQGCPRLFSRSVFVAWSLVVAIGFMIAALHWQDLTSNVADRILAPHNLILLWLLFPILKVLHELGHACAVRAFGGTVHEMGILFLVLSPVPYVDASAASTFPHKRDRMVVGGAGMMVEMFIAGIALVLWSMVEPGLLRALLFDVIFLAGVSTLLFNANPLLRFDGYYMLTDLIEMPNLARRSKSYLAFLFERHAIGNDAAVDPARSRSERVWLASYAVGSFCYRLLILSAIIIFVAKEFFAVGVLLALWAVFAWGVVPISRAFAHVVTAPQLTTVRRRAMTVTFGLTAAAVAAICFLPAPLRSQAEGVVWVPPESVVRAGADGFVARWLAQPGTEVLAGDPILLLSNQELIHRLQLLEAELAELQARRDSVRLSDRVESALLEEEAAQLAEKIAVERARATDLTVRSGGSGTLTATSPNDLLGRFVRKGDQIAHVLQPLGRSVRVVVPQSSVDLVRHEAHAVHVRHIENLGATVEAAIEREVPGGSWELPSSVLGSEGGGQTPTDPTDAAGTRALATIFQFDLRLLDSQESQRVDGRVLVRFHHGWEPLAKRWYRGIKRLFLEQSSG
ncbi:MAG: hypothetical protein AAF581_21810 [Planctomycetota bacterium]